ncbi:MAG: hypothetical protein RR213_03565, partial [Raoultibacter sp.]
MSFGHASRFVPSRFVCLLAAACIAAFLALAVFPGNAYAATNIKMQDKQAYNISDIWGATWLTCDKGGTYYVYGSSDLVILYVDVPKGQTANIVFGNTKIYPSPRAPGIPFVDRPAIRIEDTGGTVNLVTQPGVQAEFKGKGATPAIHKDGTTTKLLFTTEDPKNPGTLVARAHF